MTEAPAFIRNGRLDILATNRLGRALYDPVFADPARPVNLARYEFLNPGAADFLPHLEFQAAGAVALLRTEAGRDPYNRDLTDLVGELSTRSEKFRTLWAAHDVRLHQTGVKHFHHPAVGELSSPSRPCPSPPTPASPSPPSAPSPAPRPTTASNSSPAGPPPSTRTANRTPRPPAANSARSGSSP